MSGMKSKSKTSSFGSVKREGHDASTFYARKIYDFPRTKSKIAPVWNKPERENVIHCHDSRDMRHLPENSVHLMITSPPYNVGKDYDDDLSLEEYKQLLREVMLETYRVLVDGGRACVNVANIGRSPYIPLHAHLIEIAEKIGYLMRGEIIWDKGAGAGGSCAWGSWQSASNPTLRDVHEYILVFSKGSYKRRPIKENSIGRDEFLENTKSIWTFGPASARRVGHPAPFPIELPKRLIDLYSFVGDIVLDPFMGSGTTAEAAIDTKRKFVGYETSEEYVALSQKRIIEKLKANEFVIT